MWIKRLSTTILFTVLATSVNASEAKKVFSLGVIADCQYADQDDKGVRLYRNAKNKLADAVTELNKLPLHSVVHLGDFIDKGWSSFDTLQPIVDSSKHHFHHALGNHDFDVADDKKRLVPERMGLTSRYYSVEKSNWRFVFVDGNDISHHAWPKASAEHKQSIETYNALYAGKATYNGALGQRQLNWLDDELKKAKQAQQKVMLFGHFPVYPENVHNLWNDKKIMELLEQHDNVVAWVNGHYHKGNFATKNGITYLTIKGMLDTKETAYAVFDFYPDKVEVKGVGRQQSYSIPLL